MMITKKAGGPRDVSGTFSVDEGYLANLRCQGRGPKYFKVGRKVLYFFDDVEAWIRQHPVLTSDSEEV